MPLNSQKGTIGALIVKSTSGDQCYTEQDQELLYFVGAQLTTAIERKRLHARLQYLADYDQLTQLPNRELLKERLRRALVQARRESGRMALLYVDLDQFKQVNDTFGHGVGDLLLQAVASRLKRCVRDTDTVARIGGDEFVILLENLQQPEDAGIVAEKVRHVLSDPLRLEGQLLSVLPSIGVALYPEHGVEEQELFKHADDAMYAAKRAAKQRYSEPTSG